MAAPRIAVTAGEPAGIGPDILLAVAQQGWAAELVAVADPPRRYRRSDSRSHRRNPHRDHRHQVVWHYRLGPLALDHPLSWLGYLLQPGTGDNHLCLHPG